MKTKSLLIILGVLILLLIVINLVSTPASLGVLSEDQAIDTVIVKYPQLAEYQTTDLPPSSIETKQTSSGWYLGFVRRGSGVPGIIDAKCYYITNDKSISFTGEYSRGNSVSVESINLETCESTTSEPVVIIKPEGKCYIGGCSAQVCSDTEGVPSNCEYKPEYACYKTATCERQSTGQCGWTETAELNICLNNSRK